MYRGNQFDSRTTFVRNAEPRERVSATVPSKIDRSAFEHARVPFAEVGAGGEDSNTSIKANLRPSFPRASRTNRRKLTREDNERFLVSVHEPP
jgi:hypothetical protein